MRCDVRPVAYLVHLACIVFAICSLTVLTLGNPLAGMRAGRSAPPVLYLAGPDANDSSFTGASDGTTCDEPNLVIITHGWFEAEP